MRAENIVNRQVDNKRYEHFKKFVLSKYEYEKILNFVTHLEKVRLWPHFGILNYLNGIIILFQYTKWDPVILTNFPLIKLMVLSGKPIILSTGISD